MNEGEWGKLDELEANLWWFRALHTYLTNILRQVPTGSLVLDAGCGAGGFLASLQTTGRNVVGFDVSGQAVAYAAARLPGKVLIADVNDFPFQDNSFDLITCIDVLECKSVDPSRVIAESRRVLRPGGHALFVTAAFQSLLSEHDRAVHSVRRVTRRQLLAYFDPNAFEVVYSSYLFTLLFPLMACWKLFNRPRGEQETARSDVALPASLFNRVLLSVCKCDALLVPRVSLPVGTTVCALVRKHA